jgi:hypothetical protein
VQAAATQSATLDTLIVHKVDIVDTTGHIRALLSTDDAGPYLEYCDAGQNAINMILGTRSYGKPYMAFYDDNANAILAASIMKDGTPTFIIANPEGTVIWHSPQH